MTDARRPDSAKSEYLALAALFAAAIAIGVTYLICSQPVEMTPVVVARRNLNMGDLIKDPSAMLEIKSFPTDQAPPNALRRLDDLKGRVLKIQRRAGDSIHIDDLMSEDEPSIMSGNQLPVGYRAVGLRLQINDGDTPLAGLPLSRVDIIETVHCDFDGFSSNRILFENVLLLAVDDWGSHESEAENELLAGAVVTFALTVEDCLRLNLMQSLGSLSIAGRTSPTINAVDER